MIRFNILWSLAMAIWLGFQIDNPFSNYKDNRSFDHINVWGSDSLPLYFPLRHKGMDSLERSQSLDSQKNHWYSRMLTAMKEPILPMESNNVEIYRFTWLRTFHHPIMVRVYIQQNKTFLALKVLDGFGGFDPGDIVTDKIIRISKKNWEMLESKIKDLKFWNQPSEIESVGLDGADWILEGKVKGTYHFMTRWAPQGTEFGRVCWYILNLSGIKIPITQMY